MREIDRRTISDCQTPSLSLMQAAAAACFDAISQHFNGELAGKKAQILCGPGNNGGDGAALAMALCSAGVQTEIILFSAVAATSGDARINFESAKEFASQEANNSSFSFEECQDEAAWGEIIRQATYHDLIVDALFGTGLTRPLAGVFCKVVDYLNTIRVARDHISGLHPIVVSIDIPSGLNANIAQLIGPTVAADLTVTFTAPKPANVLAPACHQSGKLVVADISSPARLLDEANVKLFVAEEKMRVTGSSRRAMCRLFQEFARTRARRRARAVTPARLFLWQCRYAIGSRVGDCRHARLGAVCDRRQRNARSDDDCARETDRGAVGDEAVDHVLRLAAKATVIAIGPDSPPRTSAPAGLSIQ